MNIEELKIFISRSFSIISYIECNWHDENLHYKCDYCKRSEISTAQEKRDEFSFLLDFEHANNCPVIEAMDLLVGIE